MSICTCCPIHRPRRVDKLTHRNPSIDLREPMPEWCKEEMRRMGLRVKEREQRRAHDAERDASFYEDFMAQLDDFTIRGQRKDPKEWKRRASGDRED